MVRWMSGRKGSTGTTLRNINLAGEVGWSEEGSAALYVSRRIKQETGGGQHSLGEQRRK